MPPKRKRSVGATRTEKVGDEDIALPTPPQAATATATTTKRGKGRKIVARANDADEVLKACRDLKAKLRKKAADAAQSEAVASNKKASDSSDYSDSDDELMKEVEALLGNDKNKSQKDSKSEAVVVVQAEPDEIPSNIVEVAELNATEVLEGMETIALGIANQVLARQGFSMAVPSRAASNQIYIPQWDRIVLGNKTLSRNFLHVKDSRKSAITLRVMQLLHAVLTKRIHITKRDLFYTDVKLFVNQMDSDGVLDDVATMIGCTRSNLHVVASDKGLVVGRIQFEEDGDYIDCTKMGVGGKAIPPYSKSFFLVLSSLADLYQHFPKCPF